MSIRTYPSCFFNINFSVILPSKPRFLKVDERTGLEVEVEVEVTLRLTVSPSVCLGIEHTRGTCDQILLPVGMFLLFLANLQSTLQMEQ
jgi:hypothetical protein